MWTCMMGWLTLVRTLSSFQLVKLDSVFVEGEACEYREAKFHRLQ